MNKKEINSRLVEIPAWGLSFLTLSTLFILVFLLKLFQLFQFRAIEIGFYIFYVLSLPFACFIICKSHPKSVWYTPVICNAVFILLVIFYQYTNPEKSVLILMGSVFALSIIGAIIGARKG